MRHLEGIVSYGLCETAFKFRAFKFRAFKFRVLGLHLTASSAVYSHDVCSDIYVDAGHDHE